MTSSAARKKGELGLLFLIVLLVYGFWNSPFVYPLKMLVVFFHEISHGLAAIITGGSISKIELDPNLGGVCYTRGGISFIITSAGYLGSLVWGGCILVLAARTRYDQHIMRGLGVILLLSATLWVRPLFGFAFLFVALSGTAMVLLGNYLSEKVNDFLLKLVGLTTALYAIVDIKSDAIDRNIPSSDASKIAEYFPLAGSTTVGIIWIIISLIATFFFLKAAIQSPDSSEDHS